MTLIKRSEGLLPSMWNDLLDNDWFDFPNFVRKGMSVPAVNIRETDMDYKVEMAVPGMQKKDFKISLENNVLTISAEEQSEKSDKENGYTRKEFNYKSFHRSFTLPEGADDAKIAAEYKDGVLNIVIPKKENMKSKVSKEIVVS